MWFTVILEGLKSFGTFLLTNWKEVVIGLMVATILYQNFATTRFFFAADTIPYLKAQNTKLAADFKTAADGNKVLADSITGLNTVVNDEEAKSKELAAQNAALQGKLNTMAANNNKKVQTILTAPTPKTCETSIGFLRDYQKQLAWGFQE